MLLMSCCSAVAANALQEMDLFGVSVQFCYICTAKIVLGYWHQWADEKLGNSGNQGPNGQRQGCKTPDELRIRKYVECDIDAVDLATGKAAGLYNAGHWFDGGDDLTAALRALELQLSPPLPSFFFNKI